MQTLIVDIESEKEAKELSSLLAALKYVSRVFLVKKKKDIISAIQEHEQVKSAIVRKKNKAIAKYL